MELTVSLPQLAKVFDRLDAIDRKLDALVLAAVAPGSVEVAEAPKAVTKPKRTPRKVEVTEANSEDDDEDTLRARVAFEAKRVTRTLGIGGMRAAIRKATSANILQVDDVPTPQLPALLTELQAM